MRAALVLPLLLLAGCLEDAPVPTPAATPEAACEARGLTGASCEVFCALNPKVCGIVGPAPDPYPPAPPAPAPTLPAVPTVPPAPDLPLPISP